MKLRKIKRNQKSMLIKIRYSNTVMVIISFFKLNEILMSLTIQCRSRVLNMFLRTRMSCTNTSWIENIVDCKKALLWNNAGQFYWSSCFPWHFFFWLIEITNYILLVINCRTLSGSKAFSLFIQALFDFIDLWR